MPGFTAVGLFLLSLVFGLVILCLWARIALRYIRLSTLTPLGQLILTLTNPLIRPVNTLFKLQYQPGQKYDWPAFSILILVEILKIILIGLLAYHALVPITLIVIYVIADLIIQPCDLLFYAILIRVIMSYVNPSWQNPLADFLRLITNPLLSIGRRIVPDISGFDFSPFVMMILLKVISIFISTSLPYKLL